MVSRTELKKSQKELDFPFSRKLVVVFMCSKRPGVSARVAAPKLAEEAHLDSDRGGESKKNIYDIPCITVNFKKSTLFLPTFGMKNTAKEMYACNPARVLQVNQE